MKGNLLFLFLFFYCFSIAQKDIEHQSLLWLRYNFKGSLNDKMQLQQEIEERIYVNPTRQHQFVMRTTLERKLPKDWSANVGFTYFLQSIPHDPEVQDFSNQTELRPHFGLGYKQKISEKFSVNHRYRSEFRFHEQENGKFTYSNNRSRYQLSLNYQFSPKLSVNIFDEIHINLGKKIVNNMFDQNRLGGGILYKPYKSFGLELGYFNWFQQRPSGDQFYSRDIVRFTIHHQLPFRTSHAK